MFEGLQESMPRCGTSRTCYCSQRVRRAKQQRRLGAGSFRGRLNCRYPHSGRLEYRAERSHLPSNITQTSVRK